jgi:SOS-response transcriptional repressor LexA
METKKNKAMLTGSELGAAIATAIAAKGVTQKAVADEFGVRAPSVQDWIKRGTIDKSRLPKLWSYFSDVVGPQHWGLSSFPAHDGNVSTGPEIRGLVPLISSVQAGKWTEIKGEFSTSDAEQWLPCPAKHGPDTFCLRVEGHSMSNPGARHSYEPGDVIFVDPEKTPKPGDRVVARLESQEDATFKQYLEEDGRKLLKAINPDWKPQFSEITGEAMICGVVIGKWVPE